MGLQQEMDDLISELSDALREGFGVENFGDLVRKAWAIETALTDPDDLVYWTASSCLGKDGDKADLVAIDKAQEWIDVLYEEVLASQSSISKYKLNEGFKQWIRDQNMIEVAARIKMVQEELT